jgi:hypothetical protein
MFDESVCVETLCSNLFEGLIGIVLLFLYPFVFRFESNLRIFFQLSSSLV